MNQEDERFFRQNFSADSFSDAEDSETPHATYQKATFKLKLPGWSQKESVNIIKKLQGSQDYSNQPKKIRSDGKLLLSSENFNKQSQMKMLEKFKAQIYGIRHMNSERRENVHSDGERSEVLRRYSEEEKNDGQYMLKSVPANSKHSLEVQNEKQKSRKRISEILDDSNKFQEAKMEEDRHQQQTNRLIERVHEFEETIKEKQAIIKRLRKNQQQLEDKYKLQIKELQSQADTLSQTISTLRKQLIDKEFEMSELREKNRKLSTDPNTYRLQHQIELLRTRQREYLDTIRSLEMNNRSPNYSFANYNLASSQVNKQSVSVIQQVNRLQQILNQRDLEWNRRLAETMQVERTSNIEDIEKILRRYPIQSNIQSRGYNENNIQLSQNDTILSALKRLIEEVQSLKQSRSHAIVASTTSMLEQLKFIKQFIINFQRNKPLSNDYVPSHSSGISHYDDQKNIEAMLKQELFQYKNYVKEQQKNKKVFLDELNLYKEQNTQIIKENSYLRHQLGAVQMESKNIKNQTTSQMSLKEHEQINLHQQQQINILMNREEESKSVISQLRHTVAEQQSQIEEHRKYVKELEQQLMNSQPQKPLILNRPYSSPLENVEETAELNLEIERLNSLLQSEIAQLTYVNQQKVRSYDQQIRMYEERINILESTNSSNQQIIQQYQTQIQQFSVKALGGQQNQNLIIQTNKHISQQNALLKNQLGGFVTANRELQKQIKERSHAVDHLWQVKQAEFENLATIISRAKRSSQF